MKRTLVLLIAAVCIGTTFGGVSFKTVDAFDSAGVILEQPEDMSGYAGQIVATTVAASGDDLRYQWWVALPGQSRFYRSSLTGSTYKTNMLPEKDGRRVYCEITDAAGNTTCTETVALRLRSIVLTQQAKDIYGSAGQIVSTTVAADGEGLRYQWWVALPGQSRFYRSSVTGSTYKTNMLSNKDGRRIYCEITDTYGNTLQSEIVTLHLGNAPCSEHSFGDEVPVQKTEQGYCFEKVCTVCGDEEQVWYDAMVTFLDDDAKADALTHWERIMDATGIRVTSAVIAGKLQAETESDNYVAYAGWDRINALKEKGMDFVHHTYNHINLTKLTEQELHDDFSKAKQVLSANGIDSDILVYPNTAYNELVRSVAAEYFQAGVAAGGVVNTLPVDDMFTIHRVNLNDSSRMKTITFGSKTILDWGDGDGASESTGGRVVECQGIRTVDNMKEYVADAVAKDAWLVFMTHAYNSPGGKHYFDTACEEEIIAFCQDVQAMGNVKFVTMTEGMQIIANMKAN